jgi:hypothetical protein
MRVTPSLQADALAHLSQLRADVHDGGSEHCLENS